MKQMVKQDKEQDQETMYTQVNKTRTSDTYTLAEKQV